MTLPTFTNPQTKDALDVGGGTTGFVLGLLTSSNPDCPYSYANPTTSTSSISTPAGLAANATIGTETLISLLDSTLPATYTFYIRGSALGNAFVNTASVTLEINCGLLSTTITPPSILEV